MNKNKQNAEKDEPKTAQNSQQPLLFNLCRIFLGTKISADLGYATKERNKWLHFITQLTFDETLQLHYFKNYLIPIQVTINNTTSKKLKIKLAIKN